MVDNPRIFIVMIIAIILGLSGLLFAGRTYFSLVTENNSFSLSLKDGLPKTKSTTPIYSGTNQTNNGETSSVSKPPTNNTVTPTTKADLLITYTDKGFTPQRSTIKAGQIVRFLNLNSSKSLWVAAASGPSGFPLTEFNEGRSIGNYGTYDYTFSKRGTYVYYNVNFKNDVGLIAVE
jgi:plastocyanin